MNMNINALTAVLIMVLTLMLSPVTQLSAAEQVVFSGEVTRVTGQRLEITLPDNQKIWVTMDQPVPEEVVGKQVSGQYIELGDTLLLKNPIFQ